MEENKPLETDSEISDEELEKDLQEIDKATEGEEDVQEASFTQEELEQIAKRKFKDKEDALKHFANLESKVGTLPPKRVEKKMETAIESPIPTEVTSIREELDELKFVRKFPDAEKHLDLIRSIAKGDKIKLENAFEKVKSYLDASETQAKEKDIAIESKNRIAPKELEKKNAVIEQFKKNRTAENETKLVSELLGLK